MNDQFTLAAGTWNAVRPDGSQETIVSDGTTTVDVDKFAYVMAQPPQFPHKHEANEKRP